MSQTRPRTTACLVALALTTQVARASADEPPRHYDLKHTSSQFLLGESVVGAAAWAGAWLFTGGPKDKCNWCVSNTFDESIRSALRADDPRPPAFISHGLSVGAIPVLGLTGLIAPAGLDEQWHRGLEDAWIVANTFAITSAIGDMAKHLVARERPAFHHEVESRTEFASFPSERNKSFFSLDTAWAFAIASSSTTLAYLRGYSTAPYLAMGGGLLAISAGTLRVVGDAHWATDVLTGALVGTGIGIAVPLLLHGRQDSSASTAPTGVAVMPLGQGNGVSIAMQF